jgi:hypothetical protein
VSPDARNVEEVTGSNGDKRGGADSTASLRAYYVRKRLITVRTLLFLAPLAAIAALRNPVAGLQLALGGVVGVLNMLAVMRANERLLDRSQKFALHALGTQGRIFAVGLIPVAVAARFGEFWAVGLYLAAFFTPLALYAIEYRRSIQRGD